MNRIGKKMTSRYEQVEVFTEAEYQRRIDGVRKIMSEQGVQVTLFLECAEEAYDQWLMGRRMLSGMIVPESGELVGTLYSEFDERGLAWTDVPDYNIYRMQKQAAPVCQGLRFCRPMTGKQIAALVTGYGPERIGLVLPDHMTADLAAALREALPRAEWVDLTVPVAVFRGRKSSEEWAAIRLSRTIQAQVYEAMAQMIRPGRKMSDLSEELHYLLLDLGASNVVHAHLICDGPQNEPTAMHKYDDRRVERGDRFFALMEANGPGGQHICFGRCMTLGEPTAELVGVYDAATKLHQYAVSLMRPGATLREIAVKTRKYANLLGFDMKERLGWNWMHSLGGYYYEQLSLEDYTEDVPLAEDLLLHCHPVIYRTFPERNPYMREEVFVLNAYRVTADAPEDLIDLPFEIRVLD